MAFAISEPSTPIDILIVEPDDAIGAGMQLLFKTAGYAACSVADADAALEVLSHSFPHCLVISGELPGGLSGIDFLTRLRQMGNDTPAVIVASQGDVRGAVAAMRAGAADFLEKPLLDARLLLAVRKSIAGR